MNEALLSLRVRRKAFGDAVVLKDLELQLQPGERVSLLGPSGCGKSTLLRIAAGLDRDYTGELDSAGQSVAFVFQEPRLMPWLDVERNIGFHDDGLYDQAWVRQLIDEVGLDGFAEALPKALSGGMAQRVAIARGLYSRPKVLLLDEPFSAVDAFTRMKLQDLLLDLAERHGITLLLVTHDVDEALYLSDRVLVMGHRGTGIVRDIEVGLARPRDRRDPLLAGLKVQALTQLQLAHVV
ncbi:ABC transporter ATP-binding protein [Pseudomonas sp. CFBP 8770]|uniref:ABC transporter ATP-binding protein n=1 Tax=unclassified Pseudomonas TaxID=196821 RepID=UPI00177E967D|nr:MULTISPECIES: ABC transporter ATP-binding protein [unclassified Pseudomonas]MBD8474676.1 ABC transporter ATP-binding protein [Pseudomonas sp. CFBP 8773]MBD8647805.1 ABC transporter ATP-binding protein [Pseudomonas sp. CFBP 8770]